VLRFVVSVNHDHYWVSARAGAKLCPAATTAKLSRAVVRVFLKTSHSSVAVQHYYTRLNWVNLLSAVEKLPAVAQAAM